MKNIFILKVNVEWQAKATNPKSTWIDTIQIVAALVSIMASLLDILRCFCR